MTCVSMGNPHAVIFVGIRLPYALLLLCLCQHCICNRDNRIQLHASGKICRNPGIHHPLFHCKETHPAVLGVGKQQLLHKTHTQNKLHLCHFMVFCNTFLFFYNKIHPFRTNGKHALLHHFQPVAGNGPILFFNFSHFYIKRIFSFFLYFIPLHP